MRGKEAGTKDDRDKTNHFHKTDKGETSQAFNQRYAQDQVFYVTCTIFPFAPFQTCSAPSELFVLKTKHANFCNGMHFTETSELLLHPA